MSIDRPPETKLLDGRFITTPDDSGKFDELITMGGTKCMVHIEMIDDGHMWMGIYPEGTERRVVVNVSAVGKGELSVIVEED